MWIRADLCHKEMSQPKKGPLPMALVSLVKDDEQWSSMVDPIRPVSRRTIPVRILEESMVMALASWARTKMGCALDMDPS